MLLSSQSSTGYEGNGNRFGGLIASVVNPLSGRLAMSLTIDDLGHLRQCM